MPKPAAPDNATPATAKATGADAGSNVESLDSLTAFIAQNEARPTETDSDNQPAAVQADDAPSQLETASGDAGEADGQPPATDAAEDSPEAAPPSAEDVDGKPDAPSAKAPEDADPDALEEWLATLPKSAARKLRAQHRQLSELKRELTDLKAKQPEVTVSPGSPVILPNPNPLHQVVDLRELERLESQALAKLDAADGALDAVEALRDDVELDPDRVRQQLEGAGHKAPEDREGLLRYLRDLKGRIKSERSESDRLVKLAPRRRAELQAEAQASQQAAQHFPWLESQEGADYESFQQVLKARPVVKALGPDWQFWTACAIEGLKTIQARNAAKSRAATVMAKAPEAPARQPGKPAAAPRAAHGSAARSRFEKTGSVEDLTAALAAEL